MYESFYGFTSKPFQLNPDPSFFYGSRGHRRAMAYLEYGLHQNEGFIVITGDVGAGKTTLVRGLLQKLDSQKVVAAHLVSTQLDAGDMLRMVAAAFGVPCKGVEKADLLLALEAFLTSVTASGKRALLIVDEAQNLTARAVEELRMLSNFQLDDHALLQSFLVGQPEFRDIMQSPHMQQLRQRVIASYHLGPIDAPETCSYIEHRLRRVGWRNNPSIDEVAHSAIYAFTGGVPRRINTLCDRLLLAAFLGEKHAIGVVDVEAAIAEIRSENPEDIKPAATTAAPSGAALAWPTLHNLSQQLNLPLSAEGLQNALSDPARLKQLADLGVGFQASRIEERLTHLENTLAAMLAIMSQGTAPTGKPAVQDKPQS